MHLTVQTERSDGVAAGSGARGRAGALAPPSHAGAAPPSRRGCPELQAGRPELFQSRGQQAGWSHRPSLPPALPPFLCCVVGCLTFPVSPRPLVNAVGEDGIRRTSLGADLLHGAGIGGSTQAECRELPAPPVRQAWSHPYTLCPQGPGVPGNVARRRRLICEHYPASCQTGKKTGITPSTVFASLEKTPPLCLTRPVVSGDSALASSRFKECTPDLDSLACSVVTTVTPCQQSPEPPPILHSMKQLSVVLSAKAPPCK